MNFDILIPVQFVMNRFNLPDIQLDALVCRIFAFLLIQRHFRHEHRVAVEIWPDVEITGYLYITMVLVAYACQAAGEAGSGIVYHSEVVM